VTGQGRGLVRATGMAPARVGCGATGAVSAWAGQCGSGPGGSGEVSGGVMAGVVSTEVGPGVVGAVLVGVGHDATGAASGIVVRGRAWSGWRWPGSDATGPGRHRPGPGGAVWGRAWMRRLRQRAWKRCERE
jgi:hypothetical protein